MSAACCLPMSNAKKKTPKKTTRKTTSKTTNMSLGPVVTLVLALLASGIAVHFERSDVRFKLQIGNSAKGT